MANSGEEIQKKAEALADFVNAAIKSWNAERKKAAKPEITIVAKVGRNPEDTVRTPEKQAELVARNTSWTCNSSHMTNAARHVYLLNGSTILDYSAVVRLLKDKDDVAMLMSFYSLGMTKQGLCNYKGSRGFLPTSSDAWHVELPDSRVKNDATVRQCVVEYDRLVKATPGKRNKDFEALGYVKSILASLKK